MSDKEKIIDRILANETYAPESRLYQSLKKAMLKLPRHQLMNLEIIFNLVVNEAAEKASEKEISDIVFNRRAEDW